MDQQIWKGQYMLSNDCFLHYTFSFIHTEYDSGAPEEPMDSQFCTRDNMTPKRTPKRTPKWTQN